MSVLVGVVPSSIQYAASGVPAVVGSTPTAVIQLCCCSIGLRIISSRADDPDGGDERSGWTDAGVMRLGVLLTEGCTSVRPEVQGSQDRADALSAHSFWPFHEPRQKQLLQG
jgi:hypothetical protein